MKKEEKTGRTRQKILAAATAEFGSYGYGGASLNRICEQGIAKGLLYHNFESRDALYLACVEGCFSGLAQALREAHIGTSLAAYMTARTAYFAAHEPEARLFSEALLQPPAALQKEIAARRAPLDALNRELYGRVLDTLPLRPGVGREEAMRYFSLMQTVYNSAFADDGDTGRPLAKRMAAHENELAKMVELLLYGIAERGEQSC